jgi:hypothetical protein
MPHAAEERLKRLACERKSLPVQYHPLGRCDASPGRPVRRSRPLLAIIAAVGVLLAGLMQASPVSAAPSAPVLAVYYAWYGLPSWDPNKMSDLPATPYGPALTVFGGIHSFSIAWSPNPAARLATWTAFTDGYHTWVNGPHGVAERLNSRRFAWEANPDGLPIVA